MKASSLLPLINGYLENNEEMTAEKGMVMEELVEGAVLIGSL
jgi:hypothetical protein